MAIMMQVVDGQLVTNTTPTNTSEDTTGTTSLGKDSFLKLLVTQLQYQDPLEPSTNEDFVTQLAQFSSLEELQNLTSSFNNLNALSLVGKNVIIEVGKSEGKSLGTVAGYVQYVKIVDGEAKLSINDELYSAADLDTVIDNDYLESIIKDSETSTDEEENSGSTDTDAEADTEKTAE